MKKLLTITIVLIISLQSIACADGSLNGLSLDALPQVNITKAGDANEKPGLTENGLNQSSPGNNLLSQEEADGLVFMREEEKLAHELYLAFFELYGLPLFQNIASSEKNHMDAVKSLLEKYALPDPAAENSSGSFTNPVLQDLYDQLLAQGSQSIDEALKAGAAVEEIDILDLRERLAQTSQPDIIQVYENLEMGSRNHLRSFVSVLHNQTCEIYQPVYLSLDDYQLIISGSLETGGQGQPGGNRKGGPRS